MIVSGKGIPTSVVDSGWVGNHDVAPTVAAWADVKLNADGLDLTPYFTGKESLPERPMIAETTRFKTNRLSLLEGGYRLEWDLNSGKSELFHTAEDLKESKDISSQEPEIAHAFKGRLEELLGKPWTANKDGTVTLSKAVALKKKAVIAICYRSRKGLLFKCFPMMHRFLLLRRVKKKLGPWHLVGGESIQDDSLQLEQQQAGRVELDDAAKKNWSTKVTFSQMNRTTESFELFG